MFVCKLQKPSSGQGNYTFCVFGGKGRSSVTMCENTKYVSVSCIKKSWLLGCHLNHLNFIDVTDSVWVVLFIFHEYFSPMHLKLCEDLFAPSDILALC